MPGAWQIHVLLRRQNRQTPRRKEKKLQIKKTNSNCAGMAFLKNSSCKMRGTSRRSSPPVVFILAFWVTRFRSCYWDSMWVGGGFFRMSPNTLDLCERYFGGA